MPLPASCARPILEQFLRAESMAMWAVRAAQDDAPPHAIAFLKKHEEEEQEHLKLFEGLTGHEARGRDALPRLPRQWPALAVHLYGYESLGLEFARLLAELRPDLARVAEEEEGHVGFFEAELRRLLASPGPAQVAREYAAAWLRRLPRTVGRYLRGEELDPHRGPLEARLLGAVRARFEATALVSGA